MVQLSLVTNAMRIPAVFRGGLGGLVQPAIQPGYDLGPARSPFTSTLGSRCLGMAGWLVGCWSSLNVPTFFFGEKT